MVGCEEGGHKLKTVSELEAFAHEDCGLKWFVVV